MEVLSCVFPVTAGKNQNVLQTRMDQGCTAYPDSAGLRWEAWTRDYDGYNSMETDVAIAMTQIILAAANEGVGTCWVMAYNPFELKEALDIDDNHQLLAITPLGYPKAGYQVPVEKGRKLLDEIVEFL